MMKTACVCLSLCPSICVRICLCLSLCLCVDMVAMPVYPSAATENWGLITFRESRLLYNEHQMNIFQKQRLVSIIAHELAHNVCAMCLPSFNVIILIYSFIIIIIIIISHDLLFLPISTIESRVS